MSSIRPICKCRCPALLGVQTPNTGCNRYSWVHINPPSYTTVPDTGHSREVSDKDGGNGPDDTGTQQIQLALSALLYLEETKSWILFSSKNIILSAVTLCTPCHYLLRIHIYVHRAFYPEFAYVFFFRFFTYVPYLIFTF